MASRAFTWAGENSAFDAAMAPRDRAAKPPGMLRCTHCGDVIGVYEPLVMLTHQEVRETSYAAQPDLPSRGEYYHRACHAERQEDAPSSQDIVR